MRLTTRANAKRSVCRVRGCINIGVNNATLVLSVLAGAGRAIGGIMITRSQTVCKRKHCCDGRLGRFMCPARHDRTTVETNSFRIGCGKYSSPLGLIKAARSSVVRPASICNVAGRIRKRLIRLMYPSVNVTSISCHCRGMCNPKRSLSGPCANVLSVFSAEVEGNGNVGVFRSKGRAHSFICVSSIISTAVLKVRGRRTGNRIFGMNANITASMLAITEALVRGCRVSIPMAVSNGFHLKSVQRGCTSVATTHAVLNFRPG